MAYSSRIYYRRGGKPPVLTPGTASYYIYTLDYTWKHLYYRSDATSKVQSIGEPSAHPGGFHHAVPHSNMHVRYTFTLGGMKGALAPATPRTLGSRLHIPHRACILCILRLFTRILSCVGIDNLRGAADTYSKKSYQDPKVYYFYSPWGKSP